MTHPVIIGTLDPTTPTQRPVNSEASTMPPSRGRKSWASSYAPDEATTSR